MSQATSLRQQADLPPASMAPPSNASDEGSMTSTVIAWSSAILVLINSLYKEQFISDRERSFLKREVFLVNRDLLLGFKRYLVDNQISELVKAINHVLEPLRLQQLHEEMGDEVEAELKSQVGEEFQALARLKAQADAEAQHLEQLDEQKAQQQKLKPKSKDQPAAKSTNEIASADDVNVKVDRNQLSSEDDSEQNENEDSEDYYSRDIYNDVNAPPPPPLDESVAPSSESSPTSGQLKWPLGAKSSLQLDKAELEHIQSVLQLLGLHHISPASILVIFRKLDLLDELPREAIGVVADKISRKISRMVRLATTRLPSVSADDQSDAENSEDEDDAADEFNPEREARDDQRESQPETIMRKLRYLLIADILYIAFDLINLENGDAVGTTQIIAALSLLTASDPKETTRFVGELLAVETTAEKHAEDSSYSEIEGISIQLIIRFLYCAASLIEAILMLPKPDSPQFTTKLVAFFKDPTLQAEVRKRSINNVSRCARFLFGNRQDETQCNIEEEVTMEVFGQWPQNPMTLFSQMFVLPSLIKLRTTPVSFGEEQAETEDAEQKEDEEVEVNSKVQSVSGYNQETDPETDDEEDYKFEDETLLDPSELGERLAYLQNMLAVMKRIGDGETVDGDSEYDLFNDKQQKSMSDQQDIDEEDHGQSLEDAEQFDEEEDYDDYSPADGMSFNARDLDASLSQMTKMFEMLKSLEKLSAGEQADENEDYEDEYDDDKVNGDDGEGSRDENPLNDEIDLSSYLNSMTKSNKSPKKSIMASPRKTNGAQEKDVDLEAVD